MEKSAEIRFSLVLFISLFLHMVMIVAISLPSYEALRELQKRRAASTRPFQVRDIIVNVNQDDRRVVTPKTLLSDRDSTARGYITKEKGDHWLNNSLEFFMKRGSPDSGKSSRKISRKSGKAGVLLAAKNEIAIMLSKEESSSQDVTGRGGAGEMTRIPDKNSFTRRNAIFYSSDGRFSFNTLKFRDFKYFRKMKDKIASNWFPPDMSNVAIGGYAPGRTRIMAISSQEVKIYFIMNRKGDVVKVELVDSLGNQALDKSCIEAIKMSKNFGKVPDDITGEHVVIPFIFGYYLY